MFEVRVAPRPTDAFRAVLDRDDYHRLETALIRLRDVVRGRRIWHVNSTPSGGGVAEMLSTLLPYEAGADVDVHWLVVCGSDEFFDVTKRIHNHLHESTGDAPALGESERQVYDRALGPEQAEIDGLVDVGDLVILHDPQTAGLTPHLRARGVDVVWRCHVGVDAPGPLARAAWSFLARDVGAADVCVFSRASYVWDGIDPERVAIVPPCIDVMSPKNQPLSPATVRAILDVAGLVSADDDGMAQPRYICTDGSQGVVTRRADVVEMAPIPPDAPLLVQVSRWDHLKDPVGVINAFVGAVLPVRDDARLVLAGPETEGVDDDPEGAEVFAAVRREWELLPARSRSQIHLVRLPMIDDDENSAMVNALQRRADVVVQKSLAEGFGLTVAEAMWKDRPVVASGVGGIQDQIVDGVSGILLDDPCDADAFGGAVIDLLVDRARARAMGDAARRRVCDCFLPAHHFEHEVGVFEAVRA